ncbi:hypothetical protein AYI70_g6243 [Smittium culicis]|uniref:Uncharacterized protein n=1 Tax=Smittium culicis TaxID=133412 RepID=A0A1R1XQX6_9FUNG|nr:hypothetical protein AYI70_g6243 [Smittium culicis]
MPPKNSQLPKCQQTLSSYFNFTPKKVNLKSTITTDNTNNVVEDNSKFSQSPSRKNLINLQNLDESNEKVESDSLIFSGSTSDSKEKDTTCDNDNDNKLNNFIEGSNSSKLSTYNFKNRDKNQAIDFVNTSMTKKRRVSDVPDSMKFDDCLLEKKFKDKSNNTAELKLKKVISIQDSDVELDESLKNKKIKGIISL